MIRKEVADAIERLRLARMELDRADLAASVVWRAGVNPDEARAMKFAQRRYVKGRKT